MERLGWEDDQAIDHPQISKAIENAQKKVETRHFEIAVRCWITTMS